MVTTGAQPGRDRSASARWYRRWSCWCSRHPGQSVPVRCRTTGCRLLGFKSSRSWRKYQRLNTLSQVTVTLVPPGIAPNEVISRSLPGKSRFAADVSPPQPSPFRYASANRQCPNIHDFRGFSKGVTCPAISSVGHFQPRSEGGLSREGRSALLPIAVHSRTTPRDLG